VFQGHVFAGCRIDRRRMLFVRGLTGNMHSGSHSKTRALIVCAMSRGNLSPIQSAEETQRRFLRSPLAGSAET
jgi:hypothetical protein